MASKEATEAANKLALEFGALDSGNRVKDFARLLAEAFDQFAVGERNLYAQAHAGIDLLRKEVAREGVDMTRPIIELWKDMARERDRLKFRCELLLEMFDKVLPAREVVTVNNEVRLPRHGPGFEYSDD
jgi:hypothetical protein